MYALSLTLHITGLVFWMAGFLALSRLLKIHAQTGAKLDDASRRQIKGLAYGFLLAGFVLSTLTGLHQIGTSWEAFLRAGWFHAKATLLFILSLLSLLVFLRAKKYLETGKLSSSGLSAIHGAGSLLLVVIIYLVKAKPF